MDVDTAEKSEIDVGYVSEVLQRWRKRDHNIQLITTDDLKSR